MFRDSHGWRFGRIAVALTAVVIGWYLILVFVGWLFEPPQVFNVVVGGLWALLFLAWVPAELVLLTLWATKGSRRQATAAVPVQQSVAAPALPAGGGAMLLAPEPAAADDGSFDRDERSPGASFGVAAASLVLGALALPYVLDKGGFLEGTEDPSVPEVFALVLVLLSLPLAATVIVLILLWAQRRSADHRPRPHDLFRDVHGVRLGVIAYVCAVVFFALPYLFLIITEVPRGVVAPEFIPSIDALWSVWDVAFYFWVVLEVALVVCWLVRRSKRRTARAGAWPGETERCRRCHGEGCWYCDGTGRVTRGSASVVEPPLVYTPPPVYTPPRDDSDVTEAEQAVQTNGAALAAMIVGLLAAVGFWLPGVGQVAAVVAIVLGVVALTKARQPGVPGRGVAIAGLVLGAISLVAGVAMLISVMRTVDTLDTGSAGPIARPTMVAPVSVAESQIAQGALTTTLFR